MCLQSKHQQACTWSQECGVRRVTDAWVTKGMRLDASPMGVSLLPKIWATGSQGLESHHSQSTGLLCNHCYCMHGLTERISHMSEAKKLKSAPLAFAALGLPGKAKYIDWIWRCFLLFASPVFLPTKHWLFFSGCGQELISLSLKPDSGVCTAKAQQGFGDTSQAEFHPCYRIVQQHLERLRQVINSFEIFQKDPDCNRVDFETRALFRKWILSNINAVLSQDLWRTGFRTAEDTRIYCPSSYVKCHGIYTPSSVCFKTPPDH